MLKLSGALLLMLSASSVGFLAAWKYAERPRQIRRLRQALALLETDISYGFRPLDEACTLIARREREPLVGFFAGCAHYLQTLDGASTFQCWKRAVEETWPKTAMKDPEQEILLDLGKTLGGSDRADQRHHLMLAMSNLRVEENEAREEQARYEKMCKSLGVLSGLLLVILMY